LIQIAEHLNLLRDRVLAARPPENGKPWSRIVIVHLASDDEVGLVGW
jgi:hypothetical protein